MIDILCFIVDGDPVAKPRMTRRDKWKKRPSVMKYRAWKDACILSARAAGGIPEGARVFGLSVFAYFKPPKGKENRFSERHQQKPDLDNIVKAAGDSLLGDDSCICEINAAKHWSDKAFTEIHVHYEVPDEA